MSVYLFPWKRSKILVEPPPDVDYKSRLAARLAWNNNAAFNRVGVDGETTITRVWAENPKNKIAEVTIRFDKGNQGISVRIPRPTKEVVDQLAQE